MWSPKMNADGGNNPYYNFMTQVVPGDVIFSYANGSIIAAGVALGVARTSNKPTDFESMSVGSYKLHAWWTTPCYRALFMD